MWKETRQRLIIDCPPEMSGSEALSDIRACPANAGD